MHSLNSCAKKGDPDRAIDVWMDGALNPGLGSEGGNDTEKSACWTLSLNVIIQPVGLHDLSFPPVTVRNRLTPTGRTFPSSSEAEGDGGIWPTPTSARSLYLVLGRHFPDICHASAMLMRSWMA